MTLTLPKAVQAFIDSRTGEPHPAYRRWMEDVTQAMNAAGSADDLQALIDRLSTDGTISGIPEPSEMDLVQGPGIAITNGNTIGLRPLADSGVGAALVKLTRDGYGRVSGTESADTDDLPEGASNRYFTDERVDDRVAALLVAGDNVTLTYDDTANTLTVSATGGSGGEILVQDGSSAPPVMLTNEAEDDFLYSD